MALTFDRYANLINCENFDQDMLMKVEDLAMGLSENEALSFFGLCFDDLNDAEVMYFKNAYKRGLAKAKHKATEKLFAAMSDRNGGSVAMKYLQIFGDRFPADENGAIATGNGFSLKIVKD